MPVTDEDMAEVERLTRSVHRMWEGLMGEDASWRPGSQNDAHRECEQAALEQTDRQLLGWAARDPDAKVDLVGFWQVASGHKLPSPAACGWGPLSGCWRAVRSCARQLHCHNLCASSLRVGRCTAQALMPHLLSMACSKRRAWSARMASTRCWRY